MLYYGIHRASIDISFPTTPSRHGDSGEKSAYDCWEDKSHIPSVTTDRINPNSCSLDSKNKTMSCTIQYKVITSLTLTNQWTSPGRNHSCPIFANAIFNLFYTAHPWHGVLPRKVQNFQQCGEKWAKLTCFVRCTKNLITWGPPYTGLCEKRPPVWIFPA